MHLSDSRGSVGTVRAIFESPPRGRPARQTDVDDRSEHRKIGTKFTKKE